MKQGKFQTKVLAVVLCAMMLIGIFPVSASAAIGNYNKNYQSATHTVFKHTEQTLAPGVTNYTNYAYSSDGKQMVYYVTTADLNRDDVVAQVAYMDMQCDSYGMDKLSNMVACANEKYTDKNDPLYISDYYTVVSACNGDGYNMQTGEPGGVFIMGGKVKKDWDRGSNPVFLAILKDGTAVIDNTQAAWNECKEKGIQEAIDIFGNNLVWDGKDVTVSASGSYATDRHSRTMVGITEDGKLVIAVLDGRQEPFSCGGTMHELAQIMLEAGCVRAFNLDGGGSTTFIAKNEGSNETTIINRPSDGSERSISNGIIIASTAVPSDTFDHVSMNAEDEYVTVGTSTNITVTGVSPAGTAAQIPADIVYEATNGTIENSVFTATAVGEATVTAKVNGTVVGTVTVNVVVPDSIEFSSNTILIPYGKSANLEIIAKKGLNTVKVNADNFDIACDNADAGSLNGFAFTATSDEAITGCGINACFKGTELNANADLSFGKGSEVLWDFEDGDISEWTRQNKSSYNYILTPGKVSLSSKEDGGIVHSGNYALRFNGDFTVSTEGGYMSMMLGLKNAEVIDLKGATKLGMWVYFPYEAKSLNGRIYLRNVTARNEDGSIKSYNTSANITDATLDGTSNWNVGFINSFQESGWHYISFDLTQNGELGFCIPANATLLDIYINDRDNTNFNYNHLDYKSLNQNVVMYIDDVTLDYSSVVDDREAPIFSGVNYADQAMSDAAALANKQVIGGNTSDNRFAFSANVAENTAKANATGLDASTAKAYIDGTEVDCKYDNGKIAIDDIVLLNGNHTVKFSICDKQGNYASIIRNFTVNADGNNGTTILLKAHDESLDKILLGSLYYVDVVATEVQDIDCVELELDLNNISHWELDHMEVADGFVAEYKVIDADNNIVRISITKTGINDTYGELVLVSMPIRTWELPCVVCDGGTSSKGKIANYAFFKRGSETWPIDISVTVQAGTLNGTTTFAGDTVQVDTESYVWDNASPKPAEYATWNGGHDHRASTKDLYEAGTTNHVDAVALPDKPATCTEDGYTGRTYCEVCHSVVDWGTVVPATGHTWKFVDGLLMCDCGELFNGEYEGINYINGVPEDGWVGDSYYENGSKYIGVRAVDGVYYDFGDNGVCEDRVKYTGMFDIDGVNYYAKFGELVSGWYQVDGVEYYFLPETMAAADGEVTTDEGMTFTFDNGKPVNGVWEKYYAHRRYWYGESYYKNTSKNVPYLEVEIDGETYLFDKNGYVQTGIVRNHASNEKIWTWYDCGTTGVATYVQGPTVMTYKDEIYYVGENGVGEVGLGLVKIDDDYYYVRGTGLVMIGGLHVTAEKTNGLLPAGSYTFGEDGKLVFKNGVIDGYYYENSILMKGAGLVEIDGDIYYVRPTGAIMTDGSIYVSKTNGLKAAGTYRFDADGKLYVRNGIVDGYYYENDILMKGAGLVEIDGDIYYVRPTGAIMTDGSIYVSKTNGLMAAGTYRFDADGKLYVRNGIVDGYYYKNDILMKGAGLVEIDGDIYYVRPTGAIMKNGSIYVSKTNDLMDAGKYRFDTDGKMIP